MSGWQNDILGWSSAFRLDLDVNILRVSFKCTSYALCQGLARQVNNRDGFAGPLGFVATQPECLMEKRFERKRDGEGDLLQSNYLYNTRILCCDCGNHS